MAQYESPSRGDWISSCLKDLKYLNLSLSIEEIKSLKKNKFRKLLQESIQRKAFQYLLDKQGRKGIEIR